MFTYILVSTQCTENKMLVNSKIMMKVFQQANMPDALEFVYNNSHDESLHLITPRAAR